MRPRQLRGPNDVGPGLYAARRPTTSPTKSLRPRRPQSRGTTASSSSSSGPPTGFPPARLPVDNATGSEAAATVKAATAACPSRMPPPGRVVLPYAPSAAAGTAVQMTMLRSGNLSRLQHPDGSAEVRPFTAEQEPPTRVASSLSSQSTAASSVGRPSALEVLLQYVIRVDEQCLEDSDVESVARALEALRFRRRQRKGVRPTPAVSPAGVAGRAGTSRQRRSSGSSVTSSSNTVPLHEDVTAAALVAACEASSTEAAVEVLMGCYSPNGASAACVSSPVPTPSPCSSSCLLATAVVELRCQHRRLTAEDLALLDDAARDGHPGAILRIGLCLRDGCESCGVPADLTAALTYMETAASTGYLPAVHEMGLLYEMGCTAAGAVLAPDWGEALRWYRRAAAVGHAPSQLNLGKLLLSVAEEKKAVVVASPEELAELRQRSKEWLAQAAQDGSEEAHRLLKRIQ